MGLGSMFQTRVGFKLTPLWLFVHLGVYVVSLVLSSLFQSSILLSSNMLNLTEVSVCKLYIHLSSRASISIIAQCVCACARCVCVCICMSVFLCSFEFPVESRFWMSICKKEKEKVKKRFFLFKVTLRKNAIFDFIFLFWSLYLHMIFTPEAISSGIVSISSWIKSFCLSAFCSLRLKTTAFGYSLRN